MIQTRVTPFLRVGYLNGQKGNGRRLNRNRAFLLFKGISLYLKRNKKRTVAAVLIVNLKLYIQ